MANFTDKVVVITGAARGIGAATAVRFAEQGAKLVLFDVGESVDGLPYDTARSSDLEQALELVRSKAATPADAIAVVGDVRDAASVETLIKTTLDEFGTVDVAVINHGVWDLGLYWEMSDEAWQRVVDINLVGAWRVAKAVTPVMIERGKGKIVITASSTAIRPLGKSSAYISSKRGVFGLAQAMAADVSRFNVNVNVVAPGATDTPINDHQAAWDLAAGGSGGGPEHRRQRAADIPLPRENLLSPDSMASAILFLSSDHADDITGVVLPVDGGRSSAP